MAAYGAPDRLAGDHPEEDPRLNRFRYLTFDCYGTLIDWKRGIESALSSVLGGTPRVEGGLLGAYLAAEKEEERSYRSYREVLRNAAIRVALGSGIELDPKKAEAFAESVPTWPPFADTKSSLALLASKGYELHILSNVDNELLEGTIRNTGLKVDGYVTAEDARSYKPAHGHWETFMSRSGAKREEILHVAQSIYHDILPTQEMGIASAWVNRYDDPLPSEVQPSYIASGLRELAQVLV